MSSLGLFSPPSARKNKGLLRTSSTSDVNQSKSDLFGSFFRKNDDKKDTVRQNPGPYVKYGIGYGQQGKGLEKPVPDADWRNAKEENEKTKRQMQVKAVQKKNKKMDAALRQSQDGMRHFLQEVRTLSNEVKDLQQKRASFLQDKRNSAQIPLKEGKKSAKKGKGLKTEGERGKEERRSIAEQPEMASLLGVIRAPSASSSPRITLGPNSTRSSVSVNLKGEGPGPRVLGLSTGSEPPGVSIMLAQKSSKASTGAEARGLLAPVSEEEEETASTEDKPRRIPYAEADSEEEEEMRTRRRQGRGEGERKEKNSDPLQSGTDREDKLLRNRSSGVTETDSLVLPQISTGSRR